jgi:RNA-directed DNA polymerase
MEKHVLHESMDGTPQGGIISPALANCALDGLERLLREKYPAEKRLKALRMTAHLYFYSPPR